MRWTVWFAFLAVVVLGDLRVCNGARPKNSFKMKVEESNSLFNMYEQHPKYANATVCKGFDSYILEKWRTDSATNYQRLLNKFNHSCTHISGNLIIAHLHPVNGKVPDLSFLSTIVEVSGYVIIFGNSVVRISMPKLRIIRGETAFLYRERRCSLVVVHNHNIVEYLKSLDLRSLRSIINHDVCFDSNIGLCYAPFTINWDDIFERPKQQRVHYRQARHMRITMNYCSKVIQSLNQWSSSWDVLPRPRSNETLCPDSCPSYKGRRYCWDRNASMCQTLNKCQHNTCSGGQRCYRSPETGAEGCCHLQCAAGCHGDKDTDCEACLLYIDGPRCVNHCPRSTKYDPKLFREVPNPDYRLYMGTMCVKKCSEHLIKYQDNCVSSCDKENHITVNNECVPCKGVCPKKCFIAKLEQKIAKEMSYKPDDMTYTFRSVMQALVNCTIVEGRIMINALSRKDDHNKHLVNETLRPEDLWNLRNIQEFKGTLHLEMNNYPEWTNLTFLQSLRILRNANVFIVRSEMRFLGLLNLREVYHSQIFLFGNRKLCYLYHFKKNLKMDSASTVKIKGHRRVRSCLKAKLWCHPLCNRKAGCIGPGPKMCYKCQYYQAGAVCVRRCNDIPGFLHDQIGQNGTGSSTNVTGKCGRCHQQCQSSCTGPHASQCVGGCKGLQNDGNCVEKCPLIKYVNTTTSKCEKCDAACLPSLYPPDMPTNESLCSGPTNLPGENGCNFCEYLLVGRNGKPSVCLPQCPNGTYVQLLLYPVFYSKEFVNVTRYVRPQFTKVCRPCHEECSLCHSPGPYSCIQCKNYQFENKCVAKCPPELTYSLNTSVGTNKESTGSSPICLPCHEQCRKGCVGPTNMDCLNCKKVRIYISKTQWICNDTCPSHKPFDENEIKSGDTVCVDKPESQLVREAKRRVRIVITVVFILVILVALIVVAVCCLLRQRAMAKKETVRLQAKYTGALPEEEMEPLNPSFTQPNFTQLRIINERELRRGQIIGSGAFGTVYKAQWLPPREKDERQVTIPVAIKVLTDASDQSVNKELLEEARVMASVDNRYCMRLIGVCMTAQLQLVSQFMPLGSLLEYLRKNSSSISSKALLTWAHQIAKGMVYLESRSIIHRDLAARNVLVQDPNHVRITDFGLAKLLDSNEDEYLATGGKMPVKWLALECIRQRRFTHKSDVWAYGVTLWELLTFGERPYPELRAAQVCDFLQSGERLQQPDIATLDVYMLMIKCWMLDEDSRPNFAELAEEVGRMARDPSRYLVVKADEVHATDDHSQLPNLPVDHRFMAGVKEEDESMLHTSSAQISASPDPASPGDEPQTEEEEADDGDDYTPPSVGVCGPRRPLKTTGAEPASPQVCATPQHATARPPQAQCGPSDHKYGHLEAELANKQRGPASARWDRSRYATDPLDSPGGRGRREERERGKEKETTVDLPWKRRSVEGEDDDYLQPRRTAPVQGARGHRPDWMREQSPGERLPPSPANRMNKIQSPLLAPQALNPDYLETTDGAQYYNEDAMVNRRLV